MPSRNRRSSRVCIYRVLKFLMDLKKEAYVPRMVSLGPYHHAQPHLLEMETHKDEAVRGMLARIGHDVFFVIAEIQKLETEIRNCYEKDIKCNGQSLAWMLTLDGCFILEIMKALNHENVNNATYNELFHPIFHRYRIQYTGYEIMTDILMIENQIPIVVLRKLLELELGTEREANDRLSDLLVGARITRMFYPFTHRTEWRGEVKLCLSRTPKHLLDLLSNFIISSFSFENTSTASASTDSNSAQKKYNTLIPSALELHKAGIRFRSYEGGLQNIRFDKKKGLRYLPAIRISSSIETVLRNLMAFELCQASDMTVISRYVILMDELIDSQIDVALLRRAGIIKSYICSDKEVAQLVNGLCKGITRSYKDPFGEVRKDVNEHYRSKFNVWVAELAQEHFSRPWRTVSVIGAILLLLLTAVQTIFSLHRKLLKS